MINTPEMVDLVNTLILTDKRVKQYVSSKIVKNIFLTN